MGLLEGKNGLIFGVANERSLAWHITKHAVQHGATCAFSHLPGEKMDRRVRKALEAAGIHDPWMYPCDVAADEDLDALFAAVADALGTVDFVVHSIAYADRDYLKPGTFAGTPRSVFLQALSISVYSLIAIAQRARHLMSNGGAIVAMTAYGAEKASTGYNVMGVAKSALESTVRYLAAELGPLGIRVNALSAGPCRTLSSMAIEGIDTMFRVVEETAPLRRNIDTEEVGKAAVYLVSDLSSAVTGETHHVDAGLNAVAG
jgi:enoyl-[acyl-carrier protein] reductase I